MIEAGELVRPEPHQIGEDMIEELSKRAHAGDGQALAMLLEMAEDMLFEGAFGLPVEPQPERH